MFLKDFKYKLFFRIIPRLQNYFDIKNLYVDYAKKHCGKVGKNLRINGKVRGFNKNVFLDDNVNFNGCTIFGEGKLFIGRYFHSGEDIVFITQNHNYDEASAIPYDKEKIYKTTVIEDFVWLGYGVIVMPGIKVGEGAVVSAGSVLVKDVPPLAVVGGNPAKIIKYRNKERFNQLKKKNFFY